MKIITVYSAPLYDAPASIRIGTLPESEAREVLEPEMAGWLHVYEGWIHINFCKVVSLGPQVTERAPKTPRSGG